MGNTTSEKRQRNNRYELHRHERLKITQFTEYRQVYITVYTHPGFLVLSTNFHPNWEAQIHDSDSSRVVPLLLANYSLMAVPVKAGRQIIRFSYNADWQLASLAVSSVTWACLLLISLIYLVRRQLKAI